jgi:CRISPR-associated exonuclease Cas4
VIVELTPTDLRQYSYCPRVVFYQYCTHLKRPETAKMRFGKEAHELAQLLENRRSLKRYGLHTGERHFSVRLQNEQLGLVGICDLAIVTSNAVYPVEFKNTNQKPTVGHHLQMCAYALMLEYHYTLPCPHGYWHSIPNAYTYEVDFDSKLRHKTLKVLSTITAFVKDQRCPQPTPQRSKCVDCELSNFCADVF